MIMRLGEGNVGIAVAILLDINASPSDYLETVAAVPSAPGVAGVRVREVMSRGPGPRTRAPPPEGVDVGYPHEASECHHQ